METLIKLLAEVIRHIRYKNGDKLTEKCIIQNRFVQSVAETRLGGKYTVPDQVDCCKAGMMNTYHPDLADDLRDYLWAAQMEAGLAANYIARQDEPVITETKGRDGSPLSNEEAVRLLRFLERKAVQAWKSVCKRHGFHPFTGPAS